MEGNSANLLRQKSVKVGEGCKTSTEHVSGYTTLNSAPLEEGEGEKEEKMSTLRYRRTVIALFWLYLGGLVVRRPYQERGIQGIATSLAES